MFRLGPDRLVGIECGSIGRKVLEMQARMAVEEILNRLTLVRVGVVEQDDDRTPEMPEHLSHEYTHFVLTDVVEEQEIGQTQAVTLRTDRDSRYHGDLVPPALAVAVDWRVTFRGPAPDDVRLQHEAGFIGKHDVGAQPPGVFFTRGQSFRFQRSMAPSSRSTARRSGFCGLHPSRCIRRPT